VEPIPAEINMARHWFGSHFPDKTTSQLPLSFCYAGKSSWELLSSWKHEGTEQKLDDRRSQHTHSWTDPRTGLEVGCRVTVYHDFPALEWVLHFRNTGRADTPILEDVQVLDANLGKDQGDPTLYFAEGSHEKVTDFQPLEKRLLPGNRLQLSSFGGRSSDGILPFFNLAYPGSDGVILGVGWTGQWQASFTRSVDGKVHVRAGMEKIHLKLRPGEAIRSPAILLMFWSGSDRLRGHNLFRRLLLKHFTPTVSGLPVEPPVAASPHAVIGFEATTEANMIQSITNLTQNRVPIDTWWIDAGWYSCPNKPNGWAGAVGNWDTDPARYPRGLKPVADAAHARGLKFLLWIEPERVMRHTWLFRNHPDWLLPPPPKMAPELMYHVHDGFHLLDLGHPPALAWLKNKMSSLIETVGIDIYRNDFNMYPLEYWRNKEPADRQGMREIRYITGLYDFWDHLRLRHPRLLIDNCASGGRRSTSRCCAAPWSCFAATSAGKTLPPRPWPTACPSGFL
jgi:alpha-galactosidase